MWARTRTGRAAQLLLAAAVVGVRAPGRWLSETPAWPVPDPAVDCVLVENQATVTEVIGHPEGNSNNDRFYNGQGLELAYQMNDDDDGYQQGWHGTTHTLPGQAEASHTEHTKSHDRGFPITFAIDIGTDGLANDLCSIWMYGRNDDNLPAGEVRLYTCDYMFPPGAYGTSITTSDLDNDCTHVKTRIYPAPSGRKCTLDGAGQIDWTSCTNTNGDGMWWGFPVPIGTRSRYYSLYIGGTYGCVSGCGNGPKIQPGEFELYYAATPSPHSTARIRRVVF